MGIRAAITLTDAASTPVNRVFAFLKMVNDVMHWRDRTQSIEAGQNRLTLSQRTASKQAPAYKMSWRLEAPILAQTSASTSSGIQPVPTVDHTNLFTMDFVLHERASEQERKDLLAMARDLIDEAIVQAQVKDLDLVY